MSALAIPRRRVKDLRLPAEVIENWMEINKISVRKLEREEPVWPGASGKLEPLSFWKIEQIIADSDPVIWAFLNLVEQESVRGDDGEILTPAGVPWTLFPVQARLARIPGNLVVESASEVGKTRDIVLRALHGVDSTKGPESILAAANLDSSVQRIWGHLQFQLSKNPLIGGGVADSRVKPFRQLVFANDRRIDLTMCGFDGEQLRDIHVQLVLADEVAKWKNQEQWNELWRAGVPGAVFRIYSTPDGDYSSPFYALCQRSDPIDATPGAPMPKKPAKGSADEPKFKKINITKRDLPYPFWSDARDKKWQQEYGGVTSVGYLTKVEGKWGSPKSSVFPMANLKPNLKYLRDYRVVVARVDGTKRQVFLSAAQMAAGSGSIDGGWREEMLAREQIPVINAEKLAEAIAAFFPSMTDWKDHQLFCGGDLGSAKDPTELLWVRVAGPKWTDVFRLHLEHAEWPEQKRILADLDHFSGHLTKYGFDPGSAGAAVAQGLQNEIEYRTCRLCKCAVYFDERLTPFGFGEKTDEIDLETGAPLLNPNRKDAAGNEQPYRVSNKEFSTRILERQMYARNLEIAWDNGAGNEMLSGPQLMVNHIVERVTAREERVFRQKDDHYVDARRQAVLAIVKELYGENSSAPSPAPDNVVSINTPRASARVFEGMAASGGVRGLFGHTGGVRGIFG